MKKYFHFVEKFFELLYTVFMTIQQLLGPFRRAIEDYRMIEDGDKIAVGVSGGKDSLTLLALLKAYQRFSPQKFELMGITIDMGFTPDAYREVAEYCQKNEIPYHVEKTDIAQIIFEERKEKNPCSLCAKMRRGALNTVLLKHGFSKLALGHHADDVAETFFLSLFYEGRLSTFGPVAYMDRTGVSMIRPMIYLEEKDITSFARTLPVVHNPCPANKHTQREFVKNMIRTLQQDIPFVKERVIGAITHPERYNLWDHVLQTYLDARQPKDTVPREIAEENCPKD